MEESLLGILKELLVSGGLSADSLLLILIAVIAFVSYYIIRPMYSTIKTLVSKEEISIILDERVANETKAIEEYIEEKVKEEFRHFKDIEDMLKHIVSKVDKDEENGRMSYKELKELRRDIESMKQILNQFQGHMMYGRRLNDFGNQEIR